MSSARFHCHSKDCDFQPEGDTDLQQQLLEHSTSSGHPLCRLCRLSLNERESRSCERCISRARQLLAEIVQLYTLLPIERGQLHSPVYDRGAPNASDGTPLASATVLTLLAHGSPGGYARRLTTGAQAIATAVEAGQLTVRWWLADAIGPLTKAAYRRLERQVEGREHEIDNHPDDPVSISWTLTSWELYWRDLHDDPPVPTPRSVSASAAYLRANTRWAATIDTDFSQYLTELRRARALLKQVTGRNDRPLRAPASCFDCGSTLSRAFADPKPCPHRRPAQQQLVLPENPKRRLGKRTETPLGREARLTRWEDAHRRCQQGGLVELWRCDGCDREYQMEEYWLAVRQRLETKPGPAQPSKELA